MDDILTDFLRITFEKNNLVLNGIQPLHSKGIMSTLFVAQSSAGEIVIHVYHPVPEQQRHNTAKKIFEISTMLPFETLPRATVLFSEVMPDGRYVLGQTKLPGSPLGLRGIQNGVIIDSFSVAPKKYIDETLRYLAALHCISLSGFGPVRVENKTLVGEYASWSEFLHHESAVWLQTVYGNTNEFTQKRKQLAQFFSKTEKLLHCETGRLIHGDMINPGNILVTDDGVSGIIDFEWAIVGDPAWEFAFTNKIPLKAYFDERKKLGETVDENIFTKKICCYAVLWRLWGAHVHAPAKNEVYAILKKEFEIFLDIQITS